MGRGTSGVRSGRAVPRTCGVTAPAGAGRLMRIDVPACTMSGGGFGPGAKTVARIETADCGSAAKYSMDARRNYGGHNDDPRMVPN